MGNINLDEELDEEWEAWDDAELDDESKTSQEIEKVFKKK